MREGHRGAARRRIAAWHRRRRRDRSYDAACALVPSLRGVSCLLDVGCGDGYVAHHLRAMLGAATVGVDIGPSAEACIDYRRFDGVTLPFEDEQFDGLLLGFVLHHAADPAGLLRECRRVLRPGGVMIVHEDVPEEWHDRLLCMVHDWTWRARAGRCTFQQASAWCGLFAAMGLRVAERVALPRSRDLTHPIRSYRFVLRR